jgi:hypothetical protein
MNRFPLLTAALLAVSAGACAATMAVSSHVAPDLTWSAYRTFEWAPRDALPEVDPRLDGNAVFNDRMHGTVAAGLVERGWTPATAATADVLIHYHASVATRLDVAGIDRGYGGCPGGDCLESPVDYDAGTLVLDFVDAHSQRLLWRGWAQMDLQELLGDPDRMAKAIDQAVARMLSELPASGGRDGSRR